MKREWPRPTLVVVATWVALLAAGCVVNTAAPLVTASPVPAAPTLTEIATATSTPPAASVASASPNDRVLEATASATLPSSAPSPSPIAVWSPTRSPTPSPRPTTIPTALAGVTTVKIALIAIGAGTIGCGDDVVLVMRRISPTQAPLTAALRELLSLKDHSYGQSGLVNVLDQSNLQIQSVSLVDGKATIKLTGSLRLAGECDNPRVAAQLERTTHQFSTVRDVAIFLNGKPLFEALSLR